LTLIQKVKFIVRRVDEGGLLKLLALDPVYLAKVVLPLQGQLLVNLVREENADGVELGQLLQLVAEAYVLGQVAGVHLQPKSNRTFDCPADVLAVAQPDFVARDSLQQARVHSVLQDLLGDVDVNVDDDEAAHREVAEEADVLHIGVAQLVVGADLALVLRDLPDQEEDVSDVLVRGT